MPHPLASPVRTPRLNPFAFPSDTTLRFVLLVIFVFCGSARFYGDFWSAFYAREDQALADCASRTVSEMSRLTPALAGIDTNAATITAEIVPQLVHCSELLRPEVVWEITGVALTVAATALLYWLFPLWKLRTQWLQPLSASDPPQLWQELRCLCAEAALPNLPIFVWNPLGADLPLVFGSHGRYYLALSGAFVARYFYGDKAAFRAIVLHELAHLRNGDIDKTYLTIAAWLAFLATSLVPATTICFLTNPGWPDAVQLLFNSILWTGLIILSGSAVLRARECYADVQASVWDRTSSNIDRALAALRAATGEGWRRYFRFHPESTVRREILKDTSRLFRLSFGDAFGIGAAASLAVQSLSGIAAAFFPKEPWTFFLFFWSIQVVVPAIVMLFAVGAVGIGVWRAAFASLIRGEDPSKGTGRLGVALVAGYLLSKAVYLILAYLDSARGTSMPFSLVFRSLEVDFLIGIIWMVSCFLIFRWISDAASAWLEVAVDSRSPRPILILTVAIALMLVVGTFASATFVVLFLSIAPLRESPNWIYTYGLVVGPPILFASVVVWAFPLAATFWHKGSAPPAFSSWVFLDGPADKLADQVPLRPGRALATGIVIGLAFCLLLEMVYFRRYFPVEIADGIGSGFSWLQASMRRAIDDGGYAIVMAATTFQALAAVIGAVRATRLSALCGLCAASVAGGVITVGIFLFFGVGSDVALSSWVLTALVLMGQGAVIALPISIVTAWARSLTVRKLSGGPFGDGNTQRDRKEQAWSLFSRSCVASLCIAVGIGLVARIRDVALAQQGVNAYRASAERGDSDAQNELGTMYASGRSIPRDDAQALFWFRKAAEQGHANAENNLGGMYFDGRGVPQDYALALQWIGKAAEQGNAGAQNNLGTMYRLGRGVPQDDARAAVWFRKAAEQGHAAAQYNLGQIYEQGGAVVRDEMQAVMWFQKAATQGYATAREQLQAMCERGIDPACVR